MNPGALRAFDAAGSVVEAFRQVKPAAKEVYEPYVRATMPQLAKWTEQH